MTPRKETAEARSGVARWHVASLFDEAMGNEQSVSREEIHSIANFTQKDITRLYSRLKELDEDGNGQLDPKEILGVAELTENPLVQRVISVFDKECSGTVSFIEFLIGLSKLAAGTSEEDKIEVRFLDMRRQQRRFHFKRWFIQGCDDDGEWWPRRDAATAARWPTVGDRRPGRRR